QPWLTAKLRIVGPEQLKVAKRHADNPRGAGGQLRLEGLTDMPAQVHAVLACNLLGRQGSHVSRVGRQTGRADVETARGQLVRGATERFRQALLAEGLCQRTATGIPGADENDVSIPVLVHPVLADRFWVHHVEDTALARKRILFALARLVRAE